MERTPWHLRSVTCQVGSCHPTQVNTPGPNPSQTGRYSIHQIPSNGRLSWPIGERTQHDRSTSLSTFSWCNISSNCLKQRLPRPPFRQVVYALLASRDWLINIHFFVEFDFVASVDGARSRLLLSPVKLYWFRSTLCMRPNYRTP